MADLSDIRKKESDISQVEKAALILLAVGESRAADVLRHLGPKDVQLLGSTMVGISNISAATVDDVLSEFITLIKTQTGLGLKSDDFIRKMLTEALGAEKAGGIIDRILMGADSKGIEQLKWLDTRSIADLIRLEHPQIIAIVLSLLDSDQSAEVLQFLPENMRADILMRVATLEGVQPAALRELDEIMEKQLTGSDSMKSSSIGGIDAAASILNFMEASSGELIMEDILDSSAELGQQIQDKMFVFDDLANIDDRGMQTLLREVSTDQLLVALRGVDDSLKDKIFNNMSKRAAEMLRDDLEAAAPVKLSEVELAQKDVLAIAKKLADAGDIMLSGGSDELI